MAHGGDSHGVHSWNAVLHCMDEVEAAHIAYAAVLVSAMRITLVV